MTMLIFIKLSRNWITGDGRRKVCKSTLDLQTMIAQSSWWALVLQTKTSKTLFGPVNFSAFYLELHKNKFKNLIRTSIKFKFLFRGLIVTICIVNFTITIFHIEFSIKWTINMIYLPFLDLFFPRELIVINFFEDNNSI